MSSAVLPQKPLRKIVGLRDNGRNLSHEGVPSFVRRGTGRSNASIPSSPTPVPPTLALNMGATIRPHPASPYEGEELFGSGAKIQGTKFQACDEPVEPNYGVFAHRNP
jgi:hypothetical protein